MLNAKARIQGSLFELGEYELEVVAEFTRRVLEGQRVYGCFAIPERRNLEKERAEEQLDDQTYGCWLEILKRVRAVEESERQRDQKPAYTTKEPEDL